MQVSESDNAAAAATQTDPGSLTRSADVPSADEALAWLKQSGVTPDLSVTWKVTQEPGSAQRHLALLNMLFGPAEPPRAA